MTNMGGCYSLPDHAQFLFNTTTVLIAPPYNYTYALSIDPAPSAVPILVSHNQADAQSYQLWRSQKTPPTEAEKSALIDAYETTFDSTFESPTGSPGPFFNCNLIHLHPHPPHLATSADHIIHRDMATVHAWQTSAPVLDALNGTQVSHMGPDPTRALSLLMDISENRYVKPKLQRKAKTTSHSQHPRRSSTCSHPPYYPTPRRLPPPLYQRQQRGETPS
jgi:hypothetical protein